MRIRVFHETSYSYERDITALLQVLRVTPGDHQGQRVLDWRVEPSVAGRLRAGEDPYGNICHTFACDRPVPHYTLVVAGEIDTDDTSGLVAGIVEKVPDQVFLRNTDLTLADAELIAFADDTRTHGPPDTLSLMHRLLAAVNQVVSFETGMTDAATPAAEAFRLRRGVCQDLTHVFLACARHLGVPARYVSGYFLRGDGVVDQEAGHAWAEAMVPGLGWVGFDPANGISTTDAHVRVAVGLDYLGAAPVRGSRRGGGTETLDVRLRVDTAQRQSQS